MRRRAISVNCAFTYTHFGRHFVDEAGRSHSEFKRLMKRPAKKQGWFVPACTLLEHLPEQWGNHVLDDANRSRFERRWLAAKLLCGAS